MFCLGDGSILALLKSEESHIVCFFFLFQYLIGDRLSEMNGIWSRWSVRIAFSYGNRAAFRDEEEGFE